MQNTPLPDSGFNWIAPYYDTLSRLVFGNALRKAQVFWLKMIRPGSRVLLIGGGSGWLLNRLLVNCSPQKIIYIDASPTMIALSRKRVHGDQRVDFRIGNETAIRPDDRVDVVVTPFLLDLFSDERLKNRLLPPLLAALQPGGLWLCTDFLPPRRWWQRLLLWSEYRFFCTTSHIEAQTLPDWLGLLNASLLAEEMETFYGGMIGSGYWRKAG